MKIYDKLVFLSFFFAVILIKNASCTSVDQ